MRKMGKGIMYDGTRPERAKAIIAALERGMSLSIIGPVALTKEGVQEAEAQYRRWVETWVLPDLRLLFSELGIEHHDECVRNEPWPHIRIKHD